MKALHGSKGSFIHSKQLEFRVIYETFSRYTLKNVMEKGGTMRQRVFAELSQEPQISNDSSQCFADVIRKTILSQVESF